MSTTNKLIQSLLVVGAGLAMAMAIIALSGRNPLPVVGNWLAAGFGCGGPGFRCALFTTAQYATPLIFSGLSALVAFRVGLISIGQFGQMIVGAGITSGVIGWLAPAVAPGVALAAALGAGLMAAGLWGVVPGVLKAYLDVNEVIVTLILNILAPAVVGWASWRRVPDALQLTPLVPSTKLTGAFVFALAAAGLIYLLVVRHGWGFGLRMVGQAADFARYAGMRPRRVIVWGMALSGALAGLGGGLEVVGVHYRFVSNFSSIDMFDGIAVSLLGQLHPVGVVASAFLLGGLRLGALNGLQLASGVPREIGEAAIALMMILIAMPVGRRRFRGKMFTTKNAPEQKNKKTAAD